MESIPNQACDFDPSKIYQPIEGKDDHDFLDEELSMSMDLYLSDDDRHFGLSNGELGLAESAAEPHIGMAFSTRDEAREFYVAYGRHIGFTVRIHHNRRSRINNMVIGQDFVCSKEGFREKKYVHRKDRVLPPPPITREGCPAMLRVAVRDGVKWVVTKFVKDHNHPLMSPNKVPLRGAGRTSMIQDEKDQRIRELTIELHNERQRCGRCCAAYKEQVQTLLKYIEEHTEHLSRSVEGIVHCVKQLENEELGYL